MNLISDTEYNYRVRSADESGNDSVPQDRALKTKDTIAPSAITDLAVPENTDTTATLTWTEPGDNGNEGTAAEYDIRYSTAPITASNFSSATSINNPPPPKPAGAGTAESITFGSLTPATLYYAAIITSDEVGNRSGISNVPSFTTDPLNGTIDTTPPVISNIDANDIGGKFDDIRWEVTWNNNEPATSLVRFGTNQDNLSQEVSSSAFTEDHALVLTLLTRKTTYYYTVSSTDASGNSAVSSVQSFTTVGRPSKVENLQAKKGSVILTWDSVSDQTVERILVYRATPGSTQTLIATLPSSATTYTDAAAGATAAYTYTVYTEDGDGVRSEPASVSLAGVPQRSTPSAGGGGGGAPSMPSIVAEAAPGTRQQAAQPINVPTRDLALGSRGVDVRNLQRFLNTRGYTVAVQGPGAPGQETDFFGNLTQQAIQAFQRAYNIEDTGYFGPLTRIAIAALHALDGAPSPAFDEFSEPPRPFDTPAFTRDLDLGSRGEDVRRLQKFLNARGYTVATRGPGSPRQETDFFGNLTQQAVQAFQSANGIVSGGSPEITGFGRVGPQTRNHIATLGR